MFDGFYYPGVMVAKQGSRPGEQIEKTKTTMEGFIKLQRSFFDHWLWQEEVVFSKRESFLDLLQMAAFAPTKRVVQGKLIEVPVGAVIASERFLSVRWKWSRTKVRRFLKMLETDQMIEQKKDQGESVIFLCNYEKHSGMGSEEKTTKEPETSQGRATGEPNKKKVKKVKKVKNTCPTLPDSDLEVLKKIWEMSPSKSRARSSKKKVFEEWVKIKKSARPNFETAISAFQSWLACEEWTRGNGDFVPGLHLWFKNRQWQNIPEPAKDTEVYQSAL